MGLNCMRWMLQPHWLGPTVLAPCLINATRRWQQTLPACIKVTIPASISGSAQPHPLQDSPRSASARGASGTGSTAPATAYRGRKARSATRTCCMPMGLSSAGRRKFNAEPRHMRSKGAITTVTYGTVIEAACPLVRFCPLIRFCTGANMMQSRRWSESLES